MLAEDEARRESKNSERLESKTAWKESHADWKDIVCKSEVVNVDAIPESDKETFHLMREVFKKLDVDDSHGLDVDEFGELLKLLDPNTWNDQQVLALFEAADEDQNGILDIHELVHFILGADYEIASETESEDEPGPAPDGTERTKSKKDRTSKKEKSKSLRRKVRSEEALTTAQQMYEKLTMKDGRITGQLHLEDFIEIWVESSDNGLTVDVGRVLPQSIKDGSTEGPEDVSAVQLSHICKLLKENPEATLEEARQKISQVEPECVFVDLQRSMTFKRESRYKEIEDQGIDLRLTIGFKVFKRILEFVSAILQVDEYYILSSFVWTQNCVLEMDDALAMELLSRVFLKVPTKGGHLLDTPITGSDFARMCEAMNLIDNSSKKGLAYGEVAIFYANILKNMTQLRLDREFKRNKDSGGTGKKVKNKKHLSIMGRTAMSVLFEELYKVLPSSKAEFGSPLSLVFALLDRADAIAAAKNRSCPGTAQGGPRSRAATESPVSPLSRSATTAVNDEERGGTPSPDAKRKAKKHLTCGPSVGSK